MGRNFHDNSFFDRQTAAATDSNDGVQFDQEGSTVVWLDTIGTPGTVFIVEGAGSSASWTVSATDVDPSNGPSGDDVTTVDSGSVADNDKEVVHAGFSEYRWLRLEIATADTHNASVLQVPFAMSRESARQFFDRATDSTQEAPRMGEPLVTEVEHETLTPASGGTSNDLDPGAAGITTDGVHITVKNTDDDTIIWLNGSGNSGDGDELKPDESITKPYQTVQTGLWKVVTDSGSSSAGEAKMTYEGF